MAPLNNPPNEGEERVFIGLRLTDPYARDPRPCDRAVLRANLVCSFGYWDYREDGDGVIPKKLCNRPFILAVGAPQGLAGDPGAAMRRAERTLGTPGRSPYVLSQGRRPFIGFIRGSVRLFYWLVTGDSRFRLLGYDATSPSDTTLLEVFYGAAAWERLKELLGSDLPLTGDSLAAREARTRLLRIAGLRFPVGVAGAPPTLSQLNAAFAAWTAYKFWWGEFEKEGLPPKLDAANGVIREGYIVQPS